jgi:hypothetical protein
MAALLNAIPKLAKVFGPDRADAICVFTTAGTGAVTVLESFGCTVARSGVGAFTITMARGMRGSTKYHVTTQLEHTTTAALPTVTTNSPSTKTVIVSMLATATPTETTGATIHVRISTRNAT